MKSRLTTSMRNNRHQSLWLVSLLALLLILMVGTGEAAVRATLDRDTLYAGDTLTLTIESDGQQSGLQPDLTPLEKDFDVLGTSTSTQVNIINGKRSDKTLWQMQLQPRRTGLLRIPPLSVGGQKTSPVELKVTEAPQQTAAQANRHVFIEAELHPAGKQTYVQQQIPYTVRLYYDGRLQEGELNAPKLKDAIVEQLGEDKNYSTTRNGQPYKVVERHYVISPEKSGSLHIPPATFKGTIAVPQQRGRNRRHGSLMDELLGNSPFANDPFFRNSLLSSRFFGGNTSKPVTARSRPINIDIKPRPVTASRNWLPAEAVTLTDSWVENPPQFKAGEPVSRTITIQTRGLSGSQIPELAIAAPNNARLYPETPTQESRTDGKTLYGIRTQMLTYIPDAQGTLDVPAITLNWWDTRHNKSTRTTLPAWQFKVLPGATGTAHKTQAPSHNPASKGAPASPASNATQADSEQKIPEAILAAVKTNERWLVAGGGVLLALALLVTVIQRKRRPRQEKPGAAERTPRPAQHDKARRKTALQSLQKACAGNDRHAAASALLNLAQVQWPDNPPRSLSALAARLEKGQAQLSALDRSLYAAETSDWKGAALWDEFRHGLQEKTDATPDQDDGLNPLYPQHS